MYRPRVIPALLLKGLGLVKTVQFKNPRYIGDPINAVKIFNDLKADELVFLDIDASNENKKLPLKDAGVGLSRKIGGDIALDYCKESSIICYTDADVILSHDYLN